MSKRKALSKKPQHPAKSHGGGPERQLRKDHEGSTANESSQGRSSQGRSCQGRLPSSAAVRETIESVVVAFVLAFLFRTFEAEAFVIPTGSMAPTLMGRHKDLDCDVCKYRFRVSASEEVNQETGALTLNYVEECICPMCRHPMNLGSGASAERKYPSFKGDRILVGKFSYEFSEPKRWDVAVFKYPHEAKTNFIKRLVGKPGELVWIRRGDIFTGPLHEHQELRQMESLPLLKQLQVLQGWTAIARKPPEKLLAMLQPVFDNDVMPKIAEYGWPNRWQSWPPSGASEAGGWISSGNDGSFETDGTAADVWLRYRHLVPSPVQWFEQQQWLESRRRFEQQPEPGEQAVAGLSPNIHLPAQLISDFNAYNGGHSSGGMREAGRLGVHWVGDLAFECILDVRELRTDSGRVVFDLVEGGRHFQCLVDVASGKATLAIDGRALSESAIVQTDIRAPGQYKILFANCDDQMRLWIDGSLVATQSYDHSAVNNRVPGEDDLAPVGVCSQGAALKLSHLRVLRDIYYIAVDDPGEALVDFRQLPDLSNPTFWGECFGEENMKHALFLLNEDQFLALGDNSPKSKDGRLWGQGSRLWGHDHVVDRDLLIGKALYIYWPDTRYKIPGLALPFFPNFSEMGFVR